jgi:GntR family transcriptional regulator/MocR family aminotransferase
MLTYSLENTNGLSLYKYLYECIKNDILSGTLSAGEKLPSKRRFAEHLEISIMTVENAYSQLIAEGYIYAIEKSGYFVSRIEKMERSEKKITSIKKKVEEPSYFLDFKTNHISEENFPYATLSRLMRNALSEKDGLLRPLQYNGVKELRDAIAKHLQEFREIRVDSEQIVIGAGTEFLYNLIIQLLGRDKIYAVENPGFQKIASIYRLNNVQFRYIDIDHAGLSAQKLQEEKTDVIHISPTHHYPTGIVMPIQRRQELLRWASKKEERYIIEDDYDSEFRFSGHPIPPMLNIDTEGKVIYMNTFSKSIAPAVRISYMILPPALLEKYRETMSFYSCTVSGFDQYMLAKFIGEGYFERHINRMRTLYRAKRDTVIDAIERSAFADRVTILEENAGLHFLMRLDTETDDKEIIRRAARVGIRLSFLSEYTHEPTASDAHVLVINYSGIDTEKLPEGIRRLEQVLL